MFQWSLRKIFCVYFVCFLKLICHHQQLKTTAGSPLVQLRSHNQSPGQPTTPEDQNKTQPCRKPCFLAKPSSSGFWYWSWGTALDAGDSTRRKGADGQHSSCGRLRCGSSVGLPGGGHSGWGRHWYLAGRTANFLLFFYFFFPDMFKKRLVWRWGDILWIFFLISAHVCGERMCFGAVL